MKVSWKKCLVQRKRKFISFPSWFHTFSSTHTLHSGEKSPSGKFSLFPSNRPLCLLSFVFRPLSLVFSTHLSATSLSFPRIGLRLLLLKSGLSPPAASSPETEDHLDPDKLGPPFSWAWFTGSPENGDDFDLDKWDPYIVTGLICWLPWNLRFWGIYRCWSRLPTSDIKDFLQRANLSRFHHVD